MQTIVRDTIWSAQQPISFGPLSISSRMTVIRLKDGGLWVHSPIAVTPRLATELERLGEVKYVVAPNNTHHLYFRDFLAAYPHAVGFVARGLRAKRPDLARYPEIPLANAPWGAELEAIFVEGLPVIGETVFFHHETNTLIVSDLLFCFGSHNTGLNRLVARLLGVHNKPAMSRTMKLMTKDKAALRRSVQRIRALPVRRVILGHDQVIEDAVDVKLDAAFGWLQ